MSDHDDVIAAFGARYKIPTGKVIGILNATCFKLDKDGAAPTVEQTIALMVVCEVYELNPFTKEIFAFLDTKKNAIIPVVSVDGWIRLINSHPAFDGLDFSSSSKLVKAGEMPGLKVPAPEWMECSIWRKDRSRPTTIREFLAEVYRNSNYPGPWQSHTNRFLRHKTLIQCARVAFGFAGIYDEDEAQNILRADLDDDQPASAATTLEQPEELALPTQPVIEPEAEPVAAPVAPVVATPPPAKPEPEPEVVDMATGEIVRGAPAPVAEPVSAPKAAPAPAPVAAKKDDLLSEAKRRYIRARMEFNGVDEERLMSEFNVSVDEIQVSQLATIGNWIEERGNA